MPTRNRTAGLRGLISTAKLTLALPEDVRSN